MRAISLSAAAMAALLALAACSGPAEEQTSAGEETDGVTSSSTLTVVTHDSFELPEEVLAQFAEESGLEVNYIQPSDGGALVNQLVLSKDAPLGDVVYGIDNTFVSRAMDEGVISPYDSEALPADSSQFAVEGMTPIDFGDVCINADLAWFEEQGLEVPTTLDDLVREEYRDLLVVPNPASSSPGLAFLIATVGAKGEDGWLEYWEQLEANGLLVVPGWSEAYYGEFSGVPDGGERPLVLSYATSPAFTIDGDTSTTVALLGTCFRQIEYAGVIEGAQNEEGAREFIDFLLSDEVQSEIPESMFMYPVVQDTELPQEWQDHAPLSPNHIQVDFAQISENRDAWIQDWTDTILG